MGETVLFIFAKEPRPGAVKTRLCPPLTAVQAERCHRAFVVDTVARVAPLARRDSVEVCLAATPQDDAPWLARVAADASVPLVWQGEGDLGQRMERLIACPCASGRAAIVVGSDAPDLPLDRVVLALEWLEDPGAVVGPSEDGGYYLIGARGSVPPVFTLSCAWGGRGVLEETLARMEAVRHPHRLLPSWSDVDDFDDLRRLAARLRGPEAGRAELPATRDALASLRSEGVAL